MIKRYLEEYILDDLRNKMAFISGPRQVGKTTLARQIGDSFFKDRFDYLNWDHRQDRKAILNGQLKADKELFIFDEIHKYKNWKNYLKGQYDKYKDRSHILVTGSARLDIYRRGGDSLLGRYHSYRLHPFSIAELSARPRQFEPFSELNFSRPDKRLFAMLFKFGGFPEVFTKQKERELRRWHNERSERLIKDDIRDTENLRDLSALQVLVELLPSKVGALFSLNSLREDLNVTHKTIALWADILEKFYYHFRIYPFRSTIIKSLRKEPKLYLWDWSEIEDEGIRLENMVASHLLKFCHFLCDVEGYKAQLYYLRDNEQREVDFLVCIGAKPWFCVEVKNSFKGWLAPLKYFGSRLKVPLLYEVVRDEEIDFLKEDIRVIGAARFLSGLV